MMTDTKNSEIKLNNNVTVFSSKETTAMKKIKTVVVNYFQL